MRIAPKGYYRQLLKTNYPNVRIAFTHTPIINCTIIDSKSIVEYLDSLLDEYADYYSNGIKSGNMVTIIENTIDEYYYSPGELYFKS